MALGKIGSNVINKMILNNIVKADFITIDTEKLNLDSSKAPKKIFVSSITSFEAMEDLRKQTEKEFQNADMVFIIAEMGEKTGTLLFISCGRNCEIYEYTNGCNSVKAF